MNGPTTTFNLAGEWDEYETDTVTDLGTHTLSVSVNVLNETNVTLYPNPVQSNELYFNSSPPLNVEIYDITGKLILSKNLKNSSKSIEISDLNSGLYIVKMTNDFGVQVKKLIRQ